MILFHGFQLTKLKCDLSITMIEKTDIIARYVQMNPNSAEHFS